MFPLTAIPALPSASGSIEKPNPLPVNINFSEFEREQDPFEKAELQTLNDMQQLAEVLQTSTATSTIPVTTANPNPVYSTSSNNPNQYTAVSGSYPYYPPRNVSQQNPFYYQPRPYFPTTFPGKFNSEKPFWCFEKFKLSKFSVMLKYLGYSKENTFLGKLYSFPESEKDIIRKVINDEKSVYAVIERSKKSKSMNSSKSLKSFT